MLVYVILLTQSVGATSSDTPKGMVLIPGGEFLMGSDKALSRPDERPVH